ncbi:hypothetical protein B1H18_28200 [Streptomyces tsukubensis]|uniref:GmrSD restriction endonucleases C-terminal domain-containing protein n=1 Tax=Streptomyces tsukubensis TaxID=83656 RepID=A0A1V4A1T9_9ACTN|nr:HNH endonuclease family protein [Streptomyces tsukubensis]OON73049.1 hypothetical protein B1H18_28200 [Streptomyces tsukubensis]
MRRGRAPRARRTAVVLFAGALLATGGCKATDGDRASGRGGGAGDSTAEAGAGSALAAVGELTVKGRAPKTGYDRNKFGSAWADVDSNHCDTRNDVLKRDLEDVKYKEGTCVIATGTLTDDPYSGKSVTFTRGRSTIDIDHLVALSDAWQKGAQQWDPAKRIALANDPLNLLAVSAGPNRSKGEGDTATWLPPKAYRCTYVAGQVAVKKKYELWVTGAERDAMQRVLSACPDQKLPSGDAPTEAPSRFHAR